MTLLGDPTDTSIKLRPLEPASGQALARDLVLKTRRRKGLGDQIAVSKYLDDEFVVCPFSSIVETSSSLTLWKTACVVCFRTRGPAWLSSLVAMIGCVLSPPKNTNKKIVA